MFEQMKAQAEQFMNSAQIGRMPENVQAMAEDGVARAREAFDKMQAAAKDQAQVAEEVMITSQAGAKAIGAKVIENTTMNTTALFDAAEAMAKARSLPEAMQMQAAFMQKQFAIAGQQSKDLFDLSSRVARQTFETMNAAATKSFEQMKKGG